MAVSHSRSSGGTFGDIEYGAADDMFGPTSSSASAPAEMNAVDRRRDESSTALPMSDLRSSAQSQGAKSDHPLQSSAPAEHAAKLAHDAGTEPADGANANRAAGGPHAAGEVQVRQRGPGNSAGNRKVLKKRQLSEWELLLASTYLTDAQESRPSRLDRNPTPDQVKYYRLYHALWLRLLLYFVVTLNFVLAVFEHPSVPGVGFPYWGTMILEVACMVFYIVRLVHYKKFCPEHLFWDKKTLLVAGCIGLTLLDMVIYIILANTLDDPDDAVRGSRILRPVFLVNFSDSRQIRKAFRNIRRTIPGIASVLILLFLSIALFSLMALKLFKNRMYEDRKGRPFFPNFFEIYWRLYVLVTTANSPDVMMPAYNKSRWFAIFFMVFLLICMYIFVSIVLAIVYQNYRKHLKNEVRKTARGRRQSLMEAWRILKVTREDSKGSIVPLEHFRQIIMYHERKRSLAQILLLFQVLDESSNGYIEKHEFMQLPELLNVGVVEEKYSQLMIARHLPRLWNSVPSELVRSVVQHRFFRYFFDFVIVVNAIIIAAEVDEITSQDNFDPIESVFLILFNIEIWLKLYTLGFWEFVRIKWNVFDFLIIEAATLFAIITSESAAGNTAIDVLLVLRVLRLVKIIGDIDSFRAIIGTIWQIGPSFSMYGGILFVIYYVYAVIGMEAFHGLIESVDYTNRTGQTSIIVGNYSADEDSWMVCNNTKLSDTEFADLRYCANNFNDIAAAFVTLFEMMVVNQWHVITQGHVAVTSKAARLYFISFHVLCVLIVLNIFVAFILEAFLMQKSKSDYESKIALKIKELGVGAGMNPTTTELSGKLQQASHGMTVQKSSTPGGSVVANEVADDPFMLIETLPGNQTMVRGMGGQDGHHVTDSVPTANSSTDLVRGMGVRAPDGTMEIHTVNDLAQAAGMHFRMTSKLSSIDMLLFRMFEEEIRAETEEDTDIYKVLDSDEDEDDEDEGDDEALALSYYHSQIRQTYRQSQLVLNRDDGAGAAAAAGDTAVVHTDYQV